MFTGAYFTPCFFRTMVLTLFLTQDMKITWGTLTNQSAPRPLPRPIKSETQGARAWKPVFLRAPQVILIGSQG